MKNSFLICYIFIFWSTNILYAQNNMNAKKIESYKENLPKDSLIFYFKLSGGDALPLAPSNLVSFLPIDSYSDAPVAGFHNVSTTHPVINGPYTYTYDNIDVSLGKGINIYGSIGCDFNKHVSAELGASYLWGSVFTAHELSEGYEGNVWLSGSHTRELYSRVVTADASIIIRRGNKKVNQYLKVGGLFSMPTIYYHETIDGHPLCNAMYQVLDWKYYGGWAAGAAASGGIIYKINKSLAIFCEVRIIALSYAPLKGKMTNYVIQGVNKLDTLPTNETDVIFSNSITQNNPNIPSQTTPAEQFKYHFPFSSWGINVGVRFNFDKEYYRKKKTAAE
jgi:hypothetical protein